MSIITSFVKFILDLFGQLTSVLSTLNTWLKSLFWLVFVWPCQLFISLLWFVLELLANIPIDISCLLKIVMVEWLIGLVYLVTVWLFDLLITFFGLIVSPFVFLVEICSRHWLMTSSSVLIFIFFVYCLKLLFIRKTSRSITIPRFLINWLLKKVKIDIPSFIKVGPIQLQTIDWDFSIYDIWLWLSDWSIKIAIKQLTIDVNCNFVFSNGDEIISSVTIQLDKVDFHLNQIEMGGAQTWEGAVTVGDVNISAPQSSFVNDVPAARAFDSIIRILGLKMPFRYYKHSSKSTFFT